MDRRMILSQVAQAEMQVAVSEEFVTRQREIVDALRRRGADTTAAKELLQTFEQVEAAHLADLDRLRAELAQAT